MIEDCGVYLDGVRLPGHLELGEAFEARAPGAVVWISLHEPTHDELSAVADEFGLHALAIEDAVKAKQRPKLEHYGDTLFVVARPVEFGVDEDGHPNVTTRELQLFVGDGFLVTVSHGRDGELTALRRDLQGGRSDLARGVDQLVHSILDRVVDSYFPVVDQLEEQVAEVEDLVFDDLHPNPAEAIYRARRQVLEVYRAIDPLGDVLSGLDAHHTGSPTEHLVPYFRDVDDHRRRIQSRLELLLELLAQALDANLAQISVRQNEDMRTISAWAAILAVPTMLAGIWGMNFRGMPELRWGIGYPLALAVLALSALLTHRQMKRSGWI